MVNYKTLAYLTIVYCRAMLGDQSERVYSKSVKIFLPEVIVLQSTAILWITQKSGAKNLFLKSHIVYLPTKYAKQLSFGCATHNQAHTSKSCSENLPAYSHCRTITYSSGLNKLKKRNTVHDQMDYGVFISTEYIRVGVIGKSLSPSLLELQYVSNCVPDRRPIAAVLSLLVLVCSWLVR
jgi:hypothetical protein